MRSPFCEVAVLLLAGGLAAQDPGANAAREEYAALMADLKAAQKAFQERLKALQATEEFQQAQKARDTGKLRALLDGIEQLDLQSFTGRFEAAAEKYSGTPEEAMFLAWIAQSSPDRDAVHRAVDALMERHLDSEHFAGFLEQGFAIARHYPAPDARAKLQQIAERSRHAAVRAHAMYLEAMMLQRDRNASADDKERAEALLTEALQLAEGTQLADAIRASQFERERLQIGMEAPDIVGEDLDGVPFKLSDYRGKVVVLDFWGDW